MSSTSHESAGLDGLNVTDAIRWGQGESRPPTVEVRYSIEWENAQWEGNGDAVILDTDMPSIIVTLSAGSMIAEVAMVSDLATAPPGALGAVTWSTELPADGGVHRKAYEGSFFLEGAGIDGGIVQEFASFPYPEGREADTLFRWVADVALPDGTALFGSQGFSLADTTDAAIFLDDLRVT